MKPPGDKNKVDPTLPDDPDDVSNGADREPKPAPEIERGGPRGPEPTRYGDWERKGRCIDF